MGTRIINRAKGMMKGVLPFCLITLSPLYMDAQTTYTLQQLKDSALHNNISIRTALHNIEAAQQQRKEAFTKYFPNVSGTGLWFNANKGMAKMDVNPSEMISPEIGAALAQSFPPEALAAMSNPVSISMMKNGKIASLMAMQPVFAGGQIVNGNKLAKVGEEVSRLQLQLSKNEVELNTEQYYWQLVSLQEKMKTIDAVDTLLADIHKDVDVAVKAGVALRNDLLQVQLRQNDLASQRLKLLNGQTIVSQLLAQFCGLSDSEGLRVGEPSSEVDDGVKKESSLGQAVGGALQSNHSSLFTPNSSLNNLPEYQLLQKQVEAAALQKKMAVGEHLPSIAVGAGYNYHNLLENDRAFGMVFATVSIPITDWWGGSHAIKRRKIELQKAEEQLADNAELLKIRMQKSWNDMEEARQQLTLAQQSIEQAQENLRIHRDYYHAGTATMRDLLEAQLLYQQSCDKRTDAYIDYEMSILRYKQATGQ